MSEFITYTIGYRVVGSGASNVQIAYKGNNDAIYQPLTVINNQLPNPAPAAPYSYTLPANTLYKHRVYTVQISSICDSRVFFGDLVYLVTQECNEVTATVNGATIDLTWDSWAPQSGDSVKEYRIEYKEVGSPGPYYVETILMSTVVAGSNYPSFTYTLTTGIVPAATYEINFYTVLEYTYYTNYGSSQAQITIGPCPVSGSTSTVAFEELENNNPGIQENNNFSILEQ
jgi:hypothetical protein